MTLAAASRIAVIAGALAALALWLFRDEAPPPAAPADAPRAATRDAIASPPVVSETAPARDPTGGPALDVRIRVTIRDDATSEPIERAEAVYVRAAPPGAWRVATDARGSGELHVSDATADADALEQFGDWLRAAPSVLLAHAAGHVWRIERPFAMKPALEVRLKAGIQIRVRMVDARGSGVAHATLFAGGGNGIGDVYTKLDRFEGATGDDGVFEVGLVKGEAASIGFQELDLIAIGGGFAAHTLIPVAEKLDVGLAVDSARLAIDVRNAAKNPIAPAFAVAHPMRGYGDGEEAMLKSHFPLELERDFLHAKGDASGRIEMPRLPRMTPAFRYRIEVVARGFVTAFREVRFDEGGRDQTIEVVLEPAHGVTIHGTVRDPAGAQIAGAVVVGENRSSPPITTDVDGRYRYDGLVLENGWWYPRVSAEGYVGEHQNLDLNGKGDDLEFDFTLWRVGPIAGVVVDQKGAPVPGATVSLTNLVGPTPFEGMKKTDAEGRFAWEPGGACTWMIQAQKETAPEDPFVYAIFTGLVEGGTLDYVAVLESVESGATLDVEVVRAKTGDGAAIEAFEVQRLGRPVLGSSQSYRLNPRIAGTHVLCEGIAPATYRVWAIARPEGTPEFGFIDVVVPNAASVVTAKLPIGATGAIRGRIAAPEGAPAADPGWSLQLLPSGNWALPRQGAWALIAPPNTTGVLGMFRTGSDGEFQFDSVPAGRVRILASGRGGAARLRGEVDVDVRVGETTDVTIAASQPASLEFLLDGIEPAVRVDVVVRDAAGRERTWTEYGHSQQRDADPFKVSFQLEAGDYTWSLTTSTVISRGKHVEWQPPRQGTITLAEGARETVALDFRDR